MAGRFASISLADVAAGIGGFVIHGEDAGDLARSASSAGDINGDGFADLLIAAPRADGAGNLLQSAGGAYVVFGKADGFGAAIDLADVAQGVGGFVIQGRELDDVAGSPAEWAGDINGDGFDDLILASENMYNRVGETPYAGGAYVIFGKAGDFGASVNLAQVAKGQGGFAIYGAYTYDYAGTDVSSAGDLNGDGFDDLVIGASFTDEPANRAGSAYVVFGKAEGFGTGFWLGNAARGVGGFELQGEYSYSNAGRTVASAGDLNSDGFDDIVIGAAHADPAGPIVSANGVAYVLFGKPGGFGSVTSLGEVAAGGDGFVIRGEDLGDFAGVALASAGDLNGDGFDDLIIGAPSADGAGNAKPSAGGAYVVFGRASGFGVEIDLGQVAQGQGGFVIHGEDAGDGMAAVTAAGDVNGDGFFDLLIGVPGADGVANTKPDAGVSYIVFGKAGGFGAAIDLAEVAGGIGGFAIFGEDPGDFAGNAPTPVGDLNGDGFDDIVIGARGADAAGNMKPDAGGAYVIFGRAFAAAITETLSIAATADAIRGEGDSGTTALTFTVTRGGTLTGTASATFTVTGSGSASAAAVDFDGGILPTGVVEFADGQSSRIITVQVAGDRNFEADEGFTVTLSNPSANAVIGDASATGSIINDDLPIISGPGSDSLPGTSSADLLVGRGGDDTLAGSIGNDTLRGSDGRDLLRGGAEDDVLKGGDGDDRLRGDDGEDLLIGGIGADVLKGGAGGDTLRGDGGDDRLVGGEGNDIFVFGPAGGRDTIADFAAGDVLDVRGFGLDDVASILAAARDGPGGVRFSFAGGDEVLIRGVALADLGPDAILV